MTQHPRTQYIVVLREKQWGVSRQGKLYGPYSDRTDALRSAIEVAHKSSLNERPSEVLTEEADGTRLVQWTFGKDPYPPLM